MRRHKFAYEALAGEEYQGLKADLVKVQESVGNFAFAAEIKQPTSKDAFFKASLTSTPITAYQCPPKTDTFVTCMHLRAAWTGACLSSMHVYLAWDPAAEISPYRGHLLR